MLISRKKNALASPAPFTLWRSISIVLIGILAASLLGSLLFIYQYIYRTLNEAYSIIAHRTAYDYVPADWPGYLRARVALQSKLIKPTIPRTLRNIFDFAPVTSTLPATLPTKPKRARF